MEKFADLAKCKILYFVKLLMNSTTYEFNYIVTGKIKEVLRTWYILCKMDRKYLRLFCRNFYDSLHGIIKLLDA